jgi:uncharacterized protein
MTPQERDLLNQLIERLRAAPPQQKDAEAEQVLRDATRMVPDAPYLLAQTVLMQDFALNQAQQRIQDLERRLAQPQPQPAQGGGSFLGGLFGGGTARPQAPAAGPWGTAPQPQPAPTTQPVPAQAFAPPGQQPSFLRSAATTAVGIAGGALLFQGLSSLFGGNHAFAKGVAPAPGLGETIVNNDYGDSTPQVEPLPDDGLRSSDAGTGLDNASADDSYDSDSFDTGGGDDWV